jgi:topoisomerase-4 subunit A
MNKPVLPPGGPGDGDRILDEPLSEALSKRYLAYALSTIGSRALPDVRDGLKPVHRRVLHAMNNMRLNPEGAARKCAKVVGEVMGNFHPHGDQSIYDALVRLAQDFAQRVPLVDGQGNFGNIDGDNPAAMRYTECKMTAAAMLLLDGIDEDAVDFKPSYDGQDEEPVVLPSGFPNLLANGSSGIAVGMATSIPPHNPAELIDACLLLLSKPEATTAEILERVPGPDFPTGGVIVESRESLLETYETGRGGVRTRAKWEKEDTGRGTYQIVVTEIPYQVKKSDLVEQLADLIDSKKAALLGDVRDESAEDIRLVLEPKSKNVEPEVLMESLFKLSALESRFPVNINVLDARGTPGVMGIKQCLIAFLAHRRDVLTRRARHRLAKIEARLHILDGLLIAYLNLDEVIRIVRYEDEPKQKLMAAFALSELQADAILNTRLRQLAKLEEMEIRREHAELVEERDGIMAMLASDKKQWDLVGTGLRQVRAILIKIKHPHDKPRPTGVIGRSVFEDAPVVDAEAALEAMIVREPITVILSDRGWIRAAKGKIDDPSELKFKEGDKLGFLAPAETTDKLLLFTRRPVLHDQLRQPAVGARSRRARADDDRARRQGEDHRHVPVQGRAQTLPGLETGLRLPDAGRRGHRQPQGGQAGADGRRGRRGLLPGGGGRPDRGDRRQRQDPDLPAGGAAGNAARQGRQAAGLSRGRPARRDLVQHRGRRLLDRHRRPSSRLGRVERVDRQAGRGRQAVAQGLPDVQAVPAQVMSSNSVIPDKRAARRSGTSGSATLWIGPGSPLRCVRDDRI